MLIDQINQEKAIYEFIGYFDDGEEKNKVINGFPVLGGVNDLNYINFPLQVVFAIGNPVTKRK